MRLLESCCFGFKVLKDGHKLEHTGRQIADRACYGSAPKALLYLFCYSLMLAQSFYSPSGYRVETEHAS